jgi:ADP-L-glycero-D-manno-heptose 6-epimerase
MYVITGGAGFIGSNIAAALDAEGADIVISDWIGSGDTKWRNIAKRRLYDIVHPQATADFLDRFRGKVRGVMHMGGVSTTTEVDVDAIVRSNIRLSIDLWNYCARENIPLVYASSGATYGDGRQGFLDRFDDDYLSRLQAAQRLRLEQACVRSLGPAGAETARPAALGRIGIFQRLRTQ